MISELKVLDSIEFKCTLGNKFLCDTSDDQYTSVVTDKGVLICNINAEACNKIPAIGYNKIVIKTSQFILQKYLDIELEPIMTYLSNDSTRDVFINLKLSVVLSPNVVCRPVCAKWSRTGGIANQCILAVLNDFGSLDLYFKVVSCSGLIEYKWLKNLTMLHIEKMKPEWNDVKFESMDTVLQEFKNRLNIHLISAFTWSQVIENGSETYTLLIAVNGKGYVVFWKINHCNIENYKDINCEIMAEFKTRLKDVKCLHWNESLNSGLLFLGTMKGAVHVLPVTSMHPTLQFSELKCLNPEISLFAPVDKIFSVQEEDYLYIIAVKLDKLLIFLFNSSGIILDSRYFAVGCIHIVDVIHLEESSFLVASLSGDLKEIIFSCKNNQLHIDWKHIYVNLNWSMYRCVGVFSSKNKVLFSFLLNCSKPNRIKEEKDTVHFTNVVNNEIDSLAYLLTNTTNSLQDHYDFFEAIRVSGLFTKKLICDRLPPEIDYESMNFLQLKTHLRLSFISEYLYDQIESSPKYTLRPSKDLEIWVQIKLIIYYAHILMELRKQKTVMGKFRETSFKLILSYLKDVMLSDIILKHQLGKSLLTEVFNIISSTRKEELTDLPVCPVCEQSLFGTCCTENHLMNRCMISLMPIIVPKYQCQQCKVYIREEVMEDLDDALCPLCDLRMDILVDQCPDLKNELVPTCKEDCIKDNDFLSALHNDQTYENFDEALT